MSGEGAPAGDATACRTLAADQALLDIMHDQKTCRNSCFTDE